MRNDQQRIAFLDYWQGHNSHLRHPNPLPDEIRQHFLKPERPSGKANWFEDFVRELTAYFVGRNEELNAIDKFVAQSPKKVLVVIGAPGTGKSALLAKWADEHQAARHFLREGDAATYEPVAVFRNLSMQLSEKFGVTWQAPDQSEPAAYRGAFDQTLKEAAKKEQVTLVIDGLDEGVRAQTKGKGMEVVQTLIDWLPEPNFLPEGVKMILSTRPELLEHRSFAAKYGEDKAEHLHLGRMTDADVRTLLYQVKSKYEVLENPAYIEAIVKRSEGNPLYLRMLLEDIAEGRITLGNIEQLPKGIIAYFERILDFVEDEGRAREMPDIEAMLQAKRETLERLVQDGILTLEQAEATLGRERAVLEGRAGVKSIELLALFCLAKEPISLKLAADVLKASKEEVHRAFEVIRTVLVGDGEGRFTIFHSAFRDYFLNLSEYTENRLHRHKNTIDKVQNLLLAYCSRWQEHKSEYALRHYAEHLSEVPDRLPELFELARNDEFAKTQEQVLPNEPNLPLLTIQLALDAAIKTEKPETMVEMVLRHALRFETTETPLQAQRRGESERAIGLAKQWLERDYKQGTLWLLLLAWSWKKEGKRELAKRCLDEILRWWQGKSLEKLEGWQSEMAGFLLGELVEVEGWKDVSSHVLREDKDLRDLAVQSAQPGKFDEALQVACEIEGARERSEALIEITVVMTKEGMIERAKETFEEAMKTKMTKEIEDPERHSKVLTEIAIAMAKVGKFEEAMKIAKEIEDARERSRALRWIAEMMVKEEMMERAERVKKAMKVAKEIEDAEERSWVMSEIATEMTKVGKFEEAMEVARKIEDVRLRLWALKEIAAEMVKAGKIEEAMKVAGEIEDAGKRSKVLSKIAGEMTRAGEFKEAMKVVKRIEDTWWRSDALGEIAVAIARTGKFEKAMRVVNEIEVAWVRSMALGGIAIEMAGAGMFEEAMKLVRRLKM